MGFSSIRYLVKEGLPQPVEQPHDVLCIRRRAHFLPALTGSAPSFFPQCGERHGFPSGARERNHRLSQGRRRHVGGGPIGEEIGKISNIESYESVSKETMCHRKQWRLWR